MITYLKQCALFYFLNGLAMIIVPELWYVYTPGAAETGPLNIHFVRDIGIAFSTSAAGLWYAFINRDAPNIPLAWLAIAFLAGHSLLHQMEMLTMSMEVPAMARDFTLIVLPILIAIIGLVKISKPGQQKGKQQRRFSALYTGVSDRK